MRKRDGGKFSFLRKGDGPLQINLSNFFKDIDIIFEKKGRRKNLIFEKKGRTFAD